jgi:hypothetical protein
MIFPGRSRSEKIVRPKTWVPDSSGAFTDDVLLQASMSLSEKVSAVFQRTKVVHSDRRLGLRARTSPADVQRSGLAQITISHLEVFGARSMQEASLATNPVEADAEADEADMMDVGAASAESIDAILEALDTIVSDEAHEGAAILYNMHAAIYLAHALIALVAATRAAHNKGKKGADG